MFWNKVTCVNTPFERIHQHQRLDLYRPRTAHIAPRRIGVCLVGAAAAPSLSLLGSSSGGHAVISCLSFGIVGTWNPAQLFLFSNGTAALYRNGTYLLVLIHCLVPSTIRIHLTC